MVKKIDVTDFGKFFNDVFEIVSAETSKAYSQKPNDLFKNNTVEIPAPGLKKETIEISMDNRPYGNVLYVKAKTKRDADYNFDIVLGRNMTLEGAKSSYIDGIITIEFAEKKKEEKYTIRPV